MTTPPTRILIADDQADVLDALKLLLLGRRASRSSRRGRRRRCSSASKRAELDAAILDLNYTRDTTSGQEGST